MNHYQKRGVVFRRLERLYALLDAELKSLGITCRICGKCCDFSRIGQILYASSLEVDYLVENSGLPSSLQDQGLCPYLRENSCSAYLFRTLGCRTFFCEGLSQEVMQEIYHRYYRELKQVAEEFGWPWSYAPFIEHLSKRMSTFCSSNLGGDFS